MGALAFVCPAAGNTITTDLEIDAGSFSSLVRNHVSQVLCPHCNEQHDLSQIAIWLDEKGQAPASG
jgi:hypothetical protein